MIRIKRELASYILQSIADQKMTLSLVVKRGGNGKDYANGDEYNLESKLLLPDKWSLSIDDNNKICYLTHEEIEWISTNKEDVDVVGYFVFNDNAVLFYDIFNESVCVENGRPFSLIPTLAIQYQDSDDDFFAIS